MTRQDSLRLTETLPGSTKREKRERNWDSRTKRCRDEEEREPEAPGGAMGA